MVKPIIALLALFIGLHSLPANAQFYSGDTTGQPNFAGPYPSIVLPVYTSTAGIYTFYQEASFDTYFLLYRDAIDPRAYQPGQPQDVYNINLYGVNDDDPTGVGDTNSRLEIALDADRQYYAVLSAFNQNTAGPTTLTITGPVQVQFVDSTPEPASWAMMIGGFAVIGGALRQRRRALATG